jgi:outer membrane lipoprotein-sorting protein
MKKLIPLGIAVTLILAALAGHPYVSAKAQTAGLMSSILSRMERNQRSLKSLRANITMEKYNAQLRDKDSYRGVVLYMPAAGRSSYMRLEWNSPQHEILAVANGQYMLYRPRLGTVIVGRTNSAPKKDNDVLRLMNMSAAQFRNEFGPFQDVQDETLWGGVHTTHFKVVPKGAASYKHIEVWVDDGGMPVQTKMVEKNDDSTTVRLTDLAKNAPISLDEFTLKLDPSVRKIKG